MGLIKDYLYTYFKKEGIVEDFHEFLVLLLNDDTISKAGSKPNRIGNDILPAYIKDRYNEYEGCTDEIIEYFKTTLYQRLYEVNHGNFSSLYEAIVEGIKQYCDDDQRKSLYFKTQEHNTIVPALMNSSAPAKRIEFYLIAQIKTGQAYQADAEKFVIIFYVVMYYLCFGFLSPKYGDIVRALDHDIFEYYNEVVEEYGYIATNGVATIYYLAHKDPPNVVALYEVADLEYYGRGPSGKVDKNKAYEYYCKALEYSGYYPQASFSIGYIQYYYHTRELQDTKIESLEKLTNTQRKIIAFQNIMNSFQGGYKLAANTLANMCEDPEIPLYLRKTCLTKEQYLIIASSGNSYYPKNRLAHHYYEQAKIQDNEQKKNEYLQKAYQLTKDAYKISSSYYKEIPIYEFVVEEDQLSLKVAELSSRMREHWAMNEVGKYFYQQGNLDIAFLYFYTDYLTKNDIAAYHLLSLFIENPDIEHQKYFEKYVQNNQMNHRERCIEICLSSFDPIIKEYAKGLK